MTEKSVTSFGSALPPSMKLNEVKNKIDVTDGGESAKKVSDIKSTKLMKNNFHEKNLSRRIQWNDEKQIRQSPLMQVK